MRGVVAADQVRGDAAGALARGAVLQCIHHRELLREAELIVAAEVQQPLAIAALIQHVAADAIAAADRAAHATAAQCVALRAQAGDALVQ
jgi:hypothetical protein